MDFGIGFRGGLSISPFSGHERRCVAFWLENAILIALCAQMRRRADFKRYEAIGICEVRLGIEFTSAACEF